MIKPLLFTGLAALLLSGCASTPPSETTGPATAPATTGNRGDRGSWNDTPSAGMTREAVLARYGDPESVRQTPQGEVWTYRPRTRGKDFIPVYGAFTQQRNGGTIGFNAAGEVTAWDWGHKRWGAWW